MAQEKELKTKWSENEKVELQKGEHETPAIVTTEPKEQLEKADTRFISSESSKTTIIDGDLQVKGTFGTPTYVHNIQIIFVGGQPYTYCALTIINHDSTAYNTFDKLYNYLVSRGITGTDLSNNESYLNAIYNDPSGAEACSYLFAVTENKKIACRGTSNQTTDDDTTLYSYRDYVFEIK